MKQTMTLNGEWHYSGRSNGIIEIPCAIEFCETERDFYSTFRLERAFLLEKKEAKSRYVLKFNGVSYQCKIFCNGIFVKEHEGIWDAFQADISDAVREGENQIQVEIRKPDFEKDSPYFFRSVLFGFIPDVMAPFGGIWKDVELQITGDSYFRKVVPSFSAPDKTITFFTKIFEGKMTDETNLTMVAEVIHPDGSAEYFEKQWEECIHCVLNEISLWSPEKPYVYKGKITLYKDGEYQDEEEFSGGFRSVHTEKGKMLINDEPFYMRGILHWGCYPEKMTPYPSYEEVKEELLKIKEMGFNTVKHCLYFPPKYYYELCDELGIVTWQELPLWLPYKNEFLMDRIFNQYPLMLDYFLQYPTVVITSLGCELDATIDSETLNKLYQMIKKKSPDMIICDNSGSGECFEGNKDSESDIYDYHFYAELYNLNELIQEFTSGYRKAKPWIFGEFNDSDTFRLVNGQDKKWWHCPDENKNPLRKVHKGFGSDQPIYYQEEILKKYGVFDEAKTLKELSICQMKEIRKFILETTRSFPEISGYNITTIRDVPTTTAGIFDDDMRSKVNAKWMQQVNGDIVIAFQKDLAREWKNGGDRFLNKDRYHYFSGEFVCGRFVLSNRSGKQVDGVCKITLEKDNKIFGSWERKFFADADETIELGQPVLSFPVVQGAEQLNLKAEFVQDHYSYSNSWPVWVYPSELTDKCIYVLDTCGILEGIEEKFNVVRLKRNAEIRNLKKGDILVTTVQEECVDEAAEKGVGVILFARDDSKYPVIKVPFYREGIVKIEPHPAMDNTAHRGYAGIQFFGIASDCALDKKKLEMQEPGYQSLIRRFDARKFFVSEYAVELCRGEGTILLSTLNLGGGQGEQPSGFMHNRFGLYLLNEWIKYVDNGAAEHGNKDDFRE